jgi:hypothetical protein
VEQSVEKKELAQRIQTQLVNCIGYQGDELQKAREDAYKYYFQRPRGDELEGRSQIVTGDLSSMVEGNLAQMTAPLSEKRIAEFCAYDAQDEEQSQIESDCVNELLFNQQNGFIEITAAIKDAMLLRNAIVKVWIDERTHKKTVRKENVDPAVIEALLDRIRQQQSVKGTEVDVAVHKYDKENKKFSATVTKKTKKFSIEAIAPENLLVPKNWSRHDLDGIPFCAERHVETRATLVERGISRELVNSLPKYARGTNQETQNARVPYNLSVAGQINTIDQTQEEVEWYECYCLLDDGDGASELRCIWKSGNYILSDEPCDFIQYAAGAIIINPHSFIAISLYDKLKSTQDTGTALTRALMDNLNATNKNRTAHLDGIVEETDLTDARHNGSIRVNPQMGILDVRQAITSFGIPDTSPNILANLEHNRRVRSEMGGASLDMATGQMQLNDRVGSQGLDRAYSVMEQLASFMTKTLANTLIRSIYLIAHETLRTQWNGPISFKRGNQWIIQEPAKWQARQAVKVNLGMSLNERARQSVALEKVMLKQEALANAGMEEILVDVTSYWKAFMAWMRVNDIPNPEQYILDPRSQKSIEAMNRKAAAAKAQQQKQDGLLHQAFSLEQVRTALDKYKHDAELQFKYWDSAIDAQIEEAKLAVQGVLDIVKAKQTAAERVKNDDAGGKKESGSKSDGKPAAAGNSVGVSS